MNITDKKSIELLSEKYSIKEILDVLVETTLDQANDYSDMGLKEKAISLTKISLALEETKESLRPIF